MPDDDAEMIGVLAALRDAEDIVHLRGLIMRGLHLCGINSVYFVAPLIADPRVGRVIYSEGLCPIWSRHYRAGLYRLDPLPRLSLQFSNAFFWPDQVEGMKLKAKEHKFLKIAARHGLERGIGVACYGPHGRTGFFGGAWPHEGKPDDRTMFCVHQITQTSYQRYCQIMLEPIDFEPLSDREFEVLGWMCRGKSNPDMAMILGVSRSSIDAYVRRIFAKLDVSDRTAACVRAYSLGLVASEEIARLVERAQSQFTS